jgi:hypothetical protein
MSYRQLYMDILRSMMPDIPLNSCVETADQAVRLRALMIEEYGFLRALTLTEALRQGLEIELKDTSQADEHGPDGMCRHYIPDPGRRCMICYPQIRALQTHSEG